VPRQTVRFAVGSPTGPRSRTWRLWVPKGKSDVYVGSRRTSNSVKLSLHEPGPSRFALTSEFIEASDFEAPEGRDARLAEEWERPRTKVPERPVARPLSIVVPWDEVLPRGVEETGDVIWTPAPPEGTCVHFDVVYVAPGVRVTGHPGARSMGTELVGRVDLENGERVFVTSIVREMQEETRAHVDKLRSARILDVSGDPIEKTGILAFGFEPNRDADTDTFIGTLLDVTRPDD
jgi:hypothetical protein